MAKSADSRAAALSTAGLPRLLTGDMRPQLRACLAPGCVFSYVKQHPRRAWCSAGRGDRARVARHYQRHLVAKTDPES
ncbi:CGNR zinc finger domain-containing protein [Streptomyces sp. NPDC093225]|uniref:CGNR zinc finger domain-containing protein n=1 Tax=Streptomyces sp. NPDC093225 TaxID=3366034 RepID=UPI00381D35F2